MGHCEKYQCKLFRYFSKKMFFFCVNDILIYSEIKQESRLIISLFGIFNVKTIFINDLR